MKLQMDTNQGGDKMASVFNSGSAQDASVIDIVRDTLNVDGSGNVVFRTRRGKGSGASSVIPGSQFDEFVDLLTATRDNREALAQQQRDVDTASVSTDETSEVSD
jgi:hypothetical protein